MMQELKRQGFQGYLSIEYEHGTVPDLMATSPSAWSSSTRRRANWPANGP